MDSQSWKSHGEYINVNGSNIFVVDTKKNQASVNTIVIISGYPTTAYDYRKILPILSEHYRVVVHDHLGFGFSDVPNSFCYSLIDQADTCVELWKKLKLKNIIVLADSYGNKVAKELIYRSNHHLIPFNFAKILFCNSVNFNDYIDLRTISNLIKNKKLVKYKEVMLHHKEELFYAGTDDYTKYQDEDRVRKIWTKFNSDPHQKEILTLCSYNEEQYLHYHRWMEAFKETEIPIKIFWRKDNFQNIKNVLLHVACKTRDNIEIIENEKCFVLDEDTLMWTLMIVKEINVNIYHSLKFKYQNY